MPLLEGVILVLQLGPSVSARKAVSHQQGVNDPLPSDYFGAYKVLKTRYFIKKTNLGCSRLTILVARKIQKVGHQAFGMFPKLVSRIKKGLPQAVRIGTQALHQAAPAALGKAQVCNPGHGPSPC